MMSVITKQTKLRSIRCPILLLTLLMPLLAYAQNSGDHQNTTLIYGSYRYQSSDKLSGITLDLNRDHTFRYEAGGCIATYHAEGKWILKQDTLRLFSSLKKKDIAIEVVEETVGFSKDTLTFAPIKNLDNEEIGVYLCFDGDTTKSCDPTLMFLTECELKVGSVDSFMLQFANGGTSGWYKIKNKLSNRFSITVPVHDLLIYYLFLEGEEYLFKNESLYVLPITNLVEWDQQWNEVKRTLILEKQAGERH